MDRMTRKGNAGYIGCENLTFVVRITLKKPDLYSKFYLPDVVNSIKNSVIMSRVFDWSTWQAAISPLPYSAGIICVWTDL